jgi:hypothetical protein
MNTLEQLKKDALEELKDNLRDYPDTDKYDMIFEIADSNTPIYTSEIMQLGADNIDLAVNEPDIGPAFDGTPTPANIVAANIFEEIQNYLYENIGLLESELEEEEDD